MKRYTVGLSARKVMEAFVPHMPWFGRVMRERYELRQQLDKVRADLAAALCIVQPEGRDFRMLTDPAHVPFYKENNFENYSVDLLLQHCEDGSTFIDIGAHHGYYTLLVATQRKHCNIMAFEPAPSNYQILNDNIRTNNALNVVTFNYAVSDHDEHMDFNLRDFSSHGSLYNDHISTVVNTVRVEAVSLDNALRTIPVAPIVIKIDAEGHELQVLKGMTALLRKNEGIVILLEFNPLILQKANQRPEELLMFITSLGFNAYFVDDERSQICKVEEKHFNKWESYLNDGNFQRGYCNILCQK